MRKSNHDVIRTVLRECDGMTVPELARTLGVMREDSVRKALKQMPDAYIDRWTAVRTALGLYKHVAIWCVVDVPPHCPRPDRIRGEGDDV